VSRVVTQCVTSCAELVIGNPICEERNSAEVSREVLCPQNVVPRSVCAHSFGTRVHFSNSWAELKQASGSAYDELRRYGPLVVA
jgi:hypothetical protein